MDKEVMHIHRTEGNQDSIEVGTPSKGGAVKIYMDMAKPDECVKRINVAAQMRKYAWDTIMGKE